MAHYLIFVAMEFFFFWRFNKEKDLNKVKRRQLSFLFATCWRWREDSLLYLELFFFCNLSNEKELQDREEAALLSLRHSLATKRRFSPLSWALLLLRSVKWRRAPGQRRGSSSFVSSNSWSRNDEVFVVYSSQRVRRNYEDEYFLLRCF